MDENKSEPHVFTEDPFSYNFISLNRSHIDELPTPTTSEVISNPSSHAIGRMLGIDNPHEWNKYYDKINLITEWAKERSNLKDPKDLVKWVNNVIRTIPNMSSNTLNSLYSHIKLGMTKGKIEFSGHTA